jgi:hypothetical protein
VLEGSFQNTASVVVSATGLLNNAAAGVNIVFATHFGSSQAITCCGAQRGGFCMLIRMRSDDDAFQKDGDPAGSTACATFVCAIHEPEAVAPCTICWVAHPG